MEDEAPASPRTVVLVEDPSPLDVSVMDSPIHETSIPIVGEISATGNPSVGGIDGTASSLKRKRVETTIPASLARKAGGSSKGTGEALGKEGRKEPAISIERMRDLLVSSEGRHAGFMLQAFDACEAYASLGRCLAHYAELSNQLKFQLEQEKAANAELVKEVDLGEEALKEVQEKVDRRDVTIDVLQSQVATAEKERSGAQEEVGRRDLIIQELRKQLAEAEKGRADAQEEVGRLKEKMGVAKEGGETSASRVGPLSTELFPSTPVAGTSPGGAPPAVASEGFPILSEISRLRRRLRSFDSKAKQVEEVLKKEEGSRSSLRRRLVEQTNQTSSAQRRVKSMEKVGVEVVSTACRKSFVAGFDRCRTLVLESSPSVNPPTADPEDGALRAELNSHVKMFSKGIQLLPPGPLLHRATQTEE